MTENDAREIERLMEKLGGSIHPIMQESGVKFISATDGSSYDEASRTVTWTVNVPATTQASVAVRVEKLKEAFAKVAEAMQNTPGILIVFAKEVEAAEQPDALDRDPVRDIAWLKKAIKHSGNPMERKRLETELNTAYKRRKRKTG